MKSCGEIIELISLYIDNELDDAKKAEVEEHISSCESCRSEIEELKEVVNMCKNVEDVELPEGFSEKLHEKLIEEKQKQEDKRRFIVLGSKYMKIASSIAAGIILVFIIRGFWLNGSINKTSDMASMANEAAKGYNGENEIAIGQKSLARDEADIKIEGSQEAGTAAAGKPEENHNKEVAVTFSEDVSDKNSSDKELQEEKISLKGTAIAVTSDRLPADSESMPVNNISIVIKTANLDEELKKVKLIAAACDIEFIETTAVFTSSPKEKIGNEETYKGIDSENNSSSTLSFKVEYSKYDRFISQLKTNYGDKAAINDISGELVRKKNELNKRLAKLQGDLKTESDPQNIKRINDEIKNITEQLSLIAAEEPYRTVTITFTQ
ncbi:MAG: anti-sigma factor family protein [Bacillota bacterium]